MFNKIYVFLIAFIAVFFDQITKFAISKQMFVGDTHTIITNVLSLCKTYNTGAAFSLFQNNMPFLIAFSVIVVFYILIYFIRHKEQNVPLLILSWGLILGGAIGNLIDRVRIGHVIDFIKLDFVNFPIFNLADVFINIGAFIILLYLLLNLKKEN